jgi:hypothetical protein
MSLDVTCVEKGREGRIGVSESLSGCGHLKLVDEGLAALLIIGLRFI